MSEHEHGQTSWSPGACELCWAEAFLQASIGPESQLEAYHRLLKENEGKPRAWRGR